MARIDTYLKVFEDVGVDVVSVSSTGSCHYKITATCNNQQKFFIAGSSKAEYRGLQNFKAEVKRWKRSTEETLR